MKNLIVLSVFLFISLAICQLNSVKTFQDSVMGSAGGPNGLIFYSNINTLDAGTIQGPITIDITMEDGAAFPDSGVAFCFNSDSGFPVSGLEIVNSCPAGSYALITNTTTGATAEPLKLRISSRNSAFKNQFFSKMIELADGGASQMVNGYVSSNGVQFVATISGGDSPYNFTVNYSYSYCPNTEIAVNGECTPITSFDMNSVNNVTVPGNSTQYYQFTVDSYDPTVNNEVSITFDSASSMVYVQRSALPTSSFNLFPTMGDASPYVIVTPSRYEDAYTETYFIALNNTGADDATFIVQVNSTGCTSNTTFGSACGYTNTTTDSTDINLNVFLLSANYTGNDNVFEFDASDNDSGYQYFLIYQLPDFNKTVQFPYYVRLTVGNDIIDGDDDDPETPAPQVYAKLNGYPSSSSFDYSVGNGFTNQLVLPINALDDQWYVAVSLSSSPKFSIWVGSNCANDCDDNAHGTCVCFNTTASATVNCDSFESDYYDAYYASLPQSTLESNGACECNDEDYVYSYDCSEKPPSTILFVTLIVIGGLIILFVAIGVPLYCYISNKRKERYERI